jgi:hypothetical protein
MIARIIRMREKDRELGFIELAVSLQTGIWSNIPTQSESVRQHPTAARSER